MISPEILRKYPFFGILEEEPLKDITMISEEIVYEDKTIIFDGGQPANALYLLVEGNLELHYIVADERNPALKKDFFVGNINPGEVFGISSIIEPHVYNATAIASPGSKVIKINAIKLREIVEADPKIALVLTKQAAKTAVERLGFTRTQLAAARA